MELDADALAARRRHPPDAVLAGRVHSGKVDRGDETGNGDGLVAARVSVVGACDPLAEVAAGARRTPAATVAVCEAAVAAARDASAEPVALVKDIGQVPVAVREAGAISDLSGEEDVVGDDGWLAVPAEAKAAVVHDGAEVVFHSARLLVGAHLEVVLESFNDVLGKYGDVRVAVASRLFMPEAERVADLMCDDAHCGATDADTDRLPRVAALAANVRPAAARADEAYVGCGVVGLRPLVEVDTGAGPPVTDRGQDDGSVRLGRAGDDVRHITVRPEVGSALSTGTLFSREHDVALEQLLAVIGGVQRVLQPVQV